VGASTVTALQRWLPAWLARLAPPSHGDVLSEPKYLYEQALDDAASAMDLIDREQERLVARLEGHLRHVEHETILAELPKGTKVHDTLGHELEEADERLTERIADALTTLIDEASERALLEALMNRQTRLRVLTDAREALIAFDRASSATREVGEGELRAIAQSMTEALHFVLLALHDVIHDPSAANVEALQEVTGERSTMMDAMRKRWLARLGGRSADQLEVLFEATTTFERVVWLVGRLERLLRDPATPGSAARA